MKKYIYVSVLIVLMQIGFMELNAQSGAISAGFGPPHSNYGVTVTNSAAGNQMDAEVQLYWADAYPNATKVVTTHNLVPGQTITVYAPANTPGLAAYRVICINERITGDEDYPTSPAFGTFNTLNFPTNHWVEVFPMTFGQETLYDCCQNPMIGGGNTVWQDVSPNASPIVYTISLNP